MEEKIKYYDKFTKTGLNAVIVPLVNSKFDFESFFISLPQKVNKVIFITTNENSTNTSKSLECFRKESINHENIFDLAFHETGYNYADKIVFNQHKEECEAFTKNTTDTSSSKDFIIHLESQNSIGKAIIIGLLWCKKNSVDYSVVLNPTSLLPTNSYENIFNELKLGNDVVLGRNENRKRKLSEGFNYLLKTIFLNFASGYWKASFIYTSCIALSNHSLNSIPLAKVKSSNGTLMDLSIKANLNNCKLTEIFVKDQLKTNSLLNKGVLFSSLKILLFGFIRRLWTKYLIRDFHPLFLFYHMTLILSSVSIYYAIKVIYVASLENRELNKLTLFSFLFFTISTIQAFAFSMWMDASDNKKLEA